MGPTMVDAGPDGTLPDWQKIPAMAGRSGTSTYTTTVDVGSGWTGGTGAYLDLGRVFGTAQVTVSGQRLPAVDQVAPNKVD